MIFKVKTAGEYYNEEEAKKLEALGFTEETEEAEEPEEAEAIASISSLSSVSSVKETHF